MSDFGELLEAHISLPCFMPLKLGEGCRQLVQDPFNNNLAPFPMDELLRSWRASERDVEGGLPGSQNAPSARAAA